MIKKIKKNLTLFVKLDWENYALEKSSDLTKHEIQLAYIQALTDDKYNKIRLKNSLLAKRMQLILVTFNPKDDKWFHVGEIRTIEGSHEILKLANEDIFILKKYIPLQTIKMKFMEDSFVINKNIGIHHLFEEGYATFPHSLID